MQNRYFSVFKTPAAAFALAASLAIGAFAEDNINLIEVSNSPADQGIYYQISRIIDFSQSSPSFPARNYPTWTNPASTQTTEYAQPILKGGPSGTCFEVSSVVTGGVSSDPVLFMYDNQGIYRTLADDNNGSSQFKARIFVLANLQAHLRISPFYASAPDTWFYFNVQKIKGAPGSTINSASCRTSLLPYHQSDLNGGLPL
jgi:hypothetical protein